MNEDLQSPSQLSRLERKLDQLAEAVSRLVLFEERQSNQNHRLEVAEKGLETLARAQLESDKKVDRLINRGVGIWAVVAVIGSATFTIFLKLAH
jgi:hypothetical protein